MRLKTASIWILFLLAAQLATGQHETRDLPTSQLTPIEAIPVLATKTIESDIKTGLPSGANVAVIKIEGLIYGYTLTSLQRRVDQAIRNGASLVVLELDTPGGHRAATRTGVPAEGGGEGRTRYTTATSSLTESTATTHCSRFSSHGPARARWGTRNERAKRPSMRNGLPRCVCGDCRIAM